MLNIIHIFAGLSSRFFYQRNGKQIQFGSLYTFDFYHFSTLTGSHQLLIINNFHSTEYHSTVVYILFTFDILFNV